MRLYQRTARMDNLLRWDVEVPRGTIGDKTMDLTYQFRLEYARDLPQPRSSPADCGKPPSVGERWAAWAAWAAECDRSFPCLGETFGRSK